LERETSGVFSMVWGFLLSEWSEIMGNLLTHNMLNASTWVQIFKEEIVATPEMKPGNHHRHHYGHWWVHVPIRVHLWRFARCFVRYTIGEVQSVFYFPALVANTPIDKGADSCPWPRKAIKGTRNGASARWHPQQTVSNLYLIQNSGSAVLQQQNPCSPHCGT
jgi:hypothetical protein